MGHLLKTEFEQLAHSGTDHSDQTLFCHIITLRICGIVQHYTRNIRNAINKSLGASLSGRCFQGLYLGDVLPTVHVPMHLCSLPIYQPLDLPLPPPLPLLCNTPHPARGSDVSQPGARPSRRTRVLGTPRTAGHEGWHCRPPAGRTDHTSLSHSGAAAPGAP